MAIIEELTATERTSHNRFYFFPQGPVRPVEETPGPRRPGAVPVPELSPFDLFYHSPLGQIRRSAGSPKSLQRSPMDKPELRVPRKIPHLRIVGRPRPRNPRTDGIPAPPNDDQRDRYLRGGQKRYFQLFQFLVFLGVMISFLGFATSSYWTLIFGLPLALFVVEQAIALYTSTFPRKIDLESHRRLVGSWQPSDYPSVDLFLPTLGEDLEIVENTMHYVARLKWPGTLKIHILDDSHRSSVLAMAEGYGFNYLARPGNEFAKAGNLRFATGHTDGEYIVILDADFVPRADFLMELMPYFDDASVGIVQSPQFFDTSTRMNWVQRAAGATQELFYRFVQPSRDSCGAAICVGSSAIYRRGALEAIGGFPKIKHSEDVFTGVEMSKHGFRTQYVPTVVSKGMCPDNLENFIAQQYRWCEGSITMVSRRDFHTDDSMTVRARLSYWSGFLYYVGTAVNALILPIPAAIMVWFYPEWVRPGNIIWLIGLPLLWFVAYPIVMTGRWRFEVLRLQTVYGFAHAFTIFHLMTRHEVGWHPTGSRKKPPVALSVKRFYTIYLGISLAVLCAGLAYRSLHTIDRFWPMVVFSLLNFYVIVPLVWNGLLSEVSTLRRSASDLPHPPALECVVT